VSVAAGWRVPAEATMVEWSDELRRAIAPHLEVFRQELRKRWPSLDPELVLLHWLCIKHNLDPPVVKLRRSADMAIVSRTDSVAVEVGNALSPCARREQPPQSARLAVKMPPITGKPGTAPPAASTPAPVSARSLDLGEEVTMRRPVPLPPVAPSTAPGASRSCATEDSAACTLVPVPPGTPKTPELRTLRRLNMAISTDARRHVVRTNILEDGRNGIVDMVANMRQELRGQFIEGVPLLSRSILSQQSQFRIVGKLRPWTFAAGEDIVVEGEVGDKLYIVERGVCEVHKTVNGMMIMAGTLSKGSFFGEIAALYDIPRTATVRTVSETIALSLSRQDLMQSVSETELESMRVIARTQVFTNIPLLASLSSEHQVSIAAALQRRTWVEGAVICGSSHLSSRLYIVEHGHVLMEAKSKALLPSFWPVGKEPTVDLGPGGFFGMRGILFNAPVGFTVTAISAQVDTLSASVSEMLHAVPVEEREAMQATMKDSMQGYLLRQIPQLRQMSDVFFRLIRSQAVEVRYKKWSVIFAKEDAIDSVYVLQQGQLMEHGGAAVDMSALPSELDDAAKRFLAMNSPPRVTPGEYFGVNCLSEKNAKAPYTLVALTDVALLRVPQGAVWSVLHEEREHISRIPLLSSEVLDKADQYMLVGKLRSWSFPAGHWIIREGEIGDMLYIVEKGVCDAIQLVDGKEAVVSHLKKGSFFGELGVMYDMPRTASVRAAVDVVVLSLSREDIFSSIGIDKLDKMRNIARTQVFAQIPMLSFLSTGLMVKVAGKLSSESFPGGSTIQEEGEATVRLRIIEKGEVRVLYKGEEVGRKLAGGTIGESSVLHKEPSWFTCTASGQVKTLSISIEEILDLAGTGERPALERMFRAAFHKMLLRQLPGLRTKGDEYISTLLSHVDIVSLGSGEVVFDAGCDLDALYILERGEVETVGEGAPGSLAESRNERARVFGAERGGGGGEESDAFKAAYTLRAASDCAFLRVPRNSVAQFLHS